MYSWVGTQSAGGSQEVRSSSAGAVGSTLPLGSIPCSTFPLLSTPPNRRCGTGSLPGASDSGRDAARRMVGARVWGRGQGASGLPLSRRPQNRAGLQGVGVRRWEYDARDGLW